MLCMIIGIMIYCDGMPVATFPQGSSVTVQTYDNPCAPNPVPPVHVLRQRIEMLPPREEIRMSMSRLLQYYCTGR